MDRGSRHIGERFVPGKVHLQSIPIFEMSLNVVRLIFGV